ncbi:MAG: rubrerythrin family protein [Candidatus Omnitrophica bacterium]|nr:rubrerythrin family protein [Candidatus Omnitrophota bacterium]
MKKELREKFAGYKAGKSIKGTQTEKNLLKAFAGESQARNRYNMFAGAAREEGFDQIAAIFDETAHNEKHHAQIFFSFLEGGVVEIQASYPAGKVGLTLENLEAAADGEHEEFVDLYPAFADVAEKEGFVKIAGQFRMIAKIEKEHEERYRKLADNVKSGKVFAKDQEVEWVCRECGHIHVGKQAPAACAACQNPRSVFEIRVKNY